MSKDRVSDEMNIFQKLASIRKKLEVLKKDSDGYGYKYVSEAEILAKLSIYLDKTGLLLIPRIPAGTAIMRTVDMEQTKVDKKTREIYLEKKCESIVCGDMVFTWINIDNPEERLDVPWFFAGQQSDVSQAFGSGLTYCTRYFLLKFFNIATVEDDPDSWRAKQKNAEREESLMIAKELVSKIDEVAKKYVADSKDPEKAKESLLSVTKKYIKSGNYLKIEEPALASKLLSEISGLIETKKKEAN